MIEQGEPGITFYPSIEDYLLQVIHQKGNYSPYEATVYDVDDERLEIVLDERLEMFLSEDPSRDYFYEGYKIKWRSLL